MLLRDSAEAMCLYFTSQASWLCKASRHLAGTEADPAESQGRGTKRTGENRDEGKKHEISQDTAEKLAQTPGTMRGTAQAAHFSPRRPRPECLPCPPQAERSRHAIEGSPMSSSQLKKHVREGQESLECEVGR